MIQLIVFIPSFDEWCIDLGGFAQRRQHGDVSISEGVAAIEIGAALVVVTGKTTVLFQNDGVQ